MKKVYVYDPTASDQLSAVRGIGRYLQILRENFSDDFEFVSQIENWKLKIENSVFINPFFNFLQPPLTMRRIAHKQIAVIHDLIPLKYAPHFPVGFKGAIYILLNKLSLKNYDLIITDSEASKFDIIKILGIKEDRIKVIYPCLPNLFTNIKSQISNKKSITNNKYQINKTTNYELQTTNYCLYVGDATWNKNLVNLARAIKLANVKCVFVGKVFDYATGGEKNLSPLEHPWNTELKKFFELTKNDSRFIFKGFVTDSELIKLYQQAEVNILPSRDEGFGFSYLEAGINGCPSLLSDIPVLKEISDNNALFFDPESSQDLAEKIKRIYSDKNLRQKLIADSKNRSLFFSLQTFKKNIIRYV